MDVVSGALSELKELLSRRDALQGFNGNALHIMHRDIYEISALLAVLKCDLKAFHEAITVVMNFYHGCRYEDESPNKYLMLGLNLMYLLATNQHPEFQMMLEQIDPAVQQSNPYISTAMKLEQSLMEGVYNKVVLTEKNIPSPYYALFVRISMDTIRDEIASCIERSFKKVTLKDAAQLLLFTNISDMTQFVKERKWRCSDSVLYFEKEQKNEIVPRSSLSTKRIAEQTIFYAKQLEMIV